MLLACSSTVSLASFNAVVVVSIAFVAPISTAVFASLIAVDTFDAASLISEENVAYAIIPAVKLARPIAAIGTPLYCRFNIDIRLLNGIYDNDIKTPYIIVYTKRVFLLNRIYCTFYLFLFQKMSNTDTDNEYDYGDFQSDNGSGNNMSVDSAPYHENVRGDTYSDDSSAMYNTSVYTDPAAKNRKSVRRVDPSTDKMATVSFFPTSTSPNRAIRHAMSGSFQSNNGRTCRVGTRDEDLFFSVILATGELGQDSCVLFYDSPEQYERHFFITLSNQTKDNWREKRNYALHEIARKRTGEGSIVIK